MDRKSPPSGVNEPLTSPALTEPDQDQVVPSESIEGWIWYASAIQIEEVVNGTRFQPLGVVNDRFPLVPTAVTSSAP